MKGCSYNDFVECFQLTPRSSTSNTNVEFAGIAGGDPFGPYAMFGGQTILRLPPVFMPTTPLSQPLITSLRPNVNSNPFPAFALSKILLVALKRPS